MSFVCPDCGYVEYHWRPKTWDTTCGDWLVRFSELPTFDKELYEALSKLKRGETVQRGHYAYKVSKTGVWVIRRWVQIWKIQGWKNIPAEKVVKGEVTLTHSQTRLLEIVRIKQSEGAK